VSSDVSLDDFLADGSPPPPLQRLLYGRRVGELARLPGAFAHWRGRCRECFRESRLRHAWFEDHNERWPPGPIHGPERQALDRLADDGCPNAEPEPEADQAPYVGGPLPLSPRHPLSQADCYLVLALIHDADRRDGGRIDPFGPGDEREMIFWVAVGSHLPGLRASDQVTLDECLARVEGDLRERGFLPPAAPQRVEVVNAEGVGLTLLGRFGELLSGLFGRRKAAQKKTPARRGNPGLDEKTRRQMVKDYADYKASGLTQRQFLRERGYFHGMDEDQSLAYLERCRKQWEVSPRGT
jgi:hypothetical protein